LFINLGRKSVFSMKLTWPPGQWLFGMARENKLFPALLQKAISNKAQSTGSSRNPEAGLQGVMWYGWLVSTAESSLPALRT
jgi:hypothetical protein